MRARPTSCHETCHSLHDALRELADDRAARILDFEWVCGFVEEAPHVRAHRAPRDEEVPLVALVRHVHRLPRVRRGEFQRVGEAPVFAQDLGRAHTTIWKIWKERTQLCSHIVPQDLVPGDDPVPAT